MYFQRIEPSQKISQLVECFWIAEDERTQPEQKKIIPDGFTEIIFHRADPYRILLKNDWELQEQNLLAGQIRGYFYLENTGRSSMIAVKLKPTALTNMYHIHAADFTDTVVDLRVLKDESLRILVEEMSREKDTQQLISMLENFFCKKQEYLQPVDERIEKAVALIAGQKGMIPVNVLCEQVSLGERQLENLFKKYVGLPPKFYAQVIRFNYIFELLQESNKQWTDLAFKAAYFDQSHFIRNFKKFTGENPTDYAFEEKSMANFFLLKK